MPQLSAAKWLVIWAICNLATAVVLVAIWGVVWAFAPPISAESAIENAKIRMEENYMRTVFLERNTTECAADKYPSGTFGPHDSFEVICSVLGDSKLLARTTFVFGRDGLAGHEDWELDNQNE